MGVKTQSDLRFFRWDILLPTASAAVAVLLIGLAGLTGYAFKQREAFALDGRVLGLVHRIESQLREADQGAEQEVLDLLWQEGHRPVFGLSLRGGQDQFLARVGETDSGLESRVIELFVGPIGGPRGRPWDTNFPRTPGPPDGRR